MDPHGLLDIVQHPVILVARQVTRSGLTERWTIDPRGALRLEGAIVDHLRDPLMPGVIRALFGMVATLYEQEKSPMAARTLVAVLARVEPHLRELWGQPSEAVTVMAEVTQKKSRAVLGVEPQARPAPAETAPPPGAIPVRSLNIPPVPRPASRTESPTTDSSPGLEGSSVAGAKDARAIDGSGQNGRPRPQDAGTETDGSPSARPARRASRRPRPQPRFRWAEDPSST